ncbi:MAG TPA: dTMP kinase [archaeon]|nr:dTMP kinase [archaeon]
MRGKSGKPLPQPRSLAAIGRPGARGKLILFEGIDGSGKSTQLALLKAALPGPVHAFRHHDREGPIGQLIESFLRHKNSFPPSAQFQLFTADFLDSAPRIRALLDGGATVLLDRWLPSAVAYQSALGFAQARSIARMLPLPKPALTLLLDLPASEAVRRKLTNPDRFDSSERLLAKVRANYLALAKARFHGPWAVLDATKTREQLAQGILAALKL